MSCKGKVYFVGVGPGDPELLTIKAKKIIDNADLIVYTGSLLDKEIFKDAKKARIVDSAGLHLEQIVKLMVDEANKGGRVARVHDGDPSIFGALLEQIIPLTENELEYEIIPGVSSVFAAAAALQNELTIPELSQTVILTRAEGRTSMPEKEKLHLLASHNATLVCYLSAALIDKTVKELRQGYSEDTPVAVVYKASCSDQKIVRGTLADIAKKVKEARINAQALIMVGRVFDEKLKMEANKYKSRLYDKTFTHSFRRGVPASPRQ